MFSGSLAPAASAALAASAGLAASTAPAAGAVKVRGIPRFAEVDSGLARGGRPTEEGIRYLKERGYRTVVSFRHDPTERDRLLRAGIAYVEIPMKAGLFRAVPPTPEQVRRFLSIVTDSSNRPVFIHCRRGRDRTGAMAAIYRIEACGWSADEAVEEMEAFGFSGHYRALKGFVRDYAPERRPWGVAAPAF
jgi:protein tyrosine phosphatase (PTP) superfamily phosphohydrolase (DUF442 family)